MLAGERVFADRCAELLEVLTVVAVVGIVMALSGMSNRMAREHVRIVEAITLVTGARVNLHEHLAVNGSWPEAGQIELSGIGLSGIGGFGEESLRRNVDSIDSGSDGALHFSMHESATSGPGYRLSLRAAIMPGHAGSPIVWVCGYADTPAGFATLARNETTIDKLRLPASCRASSAPLHRAAP